MIAEKAIKILEKPVCNNCLGRQFAQLLHGMSNMERGIIIRRVIAMEIDKIEGGPGVDMDNFSGFCFHNIKPAPKTRAKCSVCNDFFKELEIWAAKTLKTKVQFRTFLVGTKLSHELISREESLWERIGIDDCEPIKAEINRELGKLIERKGYRHDAKRPDVNFILDFTNKKISVEVNPIFIYGKYQKLARGIPQTKWPSGKYRTSVEQIIAKPFMKATGGSGHKLHGLGREDIDARCLGWRPFVLEILKPKKRSIDMKKTAKKIAKQVKVKGLRLSDIEEVRKIKETRCDKTYLAHVACEKISKDGLKKLKAITEVRQRTPQRVLHRRADRWRARKVKYIKAVYVNSKSFKIEVRGEAGLYIKELISGDDGRTKPSVSSVLGQRCTCRQLDVIKIHDEK